MEIIILGIIALQMAFLNACVFAFYMMERGHWSDLDAEE